MIIFREVDKNENAHAPYECAFAHTVLWVSYVIYHTHTHTKTPNYRYVGISLLSTLDQERNETKKKKKS